MSTLKKCNDWLLGKNYQEINILIEKMKQAGFRFESKIDPGNSITLIITLDAYLDIIKLKKYHGKLHFVGEPESKLLNELIEFLKEN